MKYNIFAIKLYIYIFENIKRFSVDVFVRKLRRKQRTDTNKSTNTNNNIHKNINTNTETVLILDSQFQDHIEMIFKFAIILNQIFQY